MTEGTKSWLFGCHSIIHTYYVVKAWKYLYHTYPKFWQLVCIVIHDIGYCGMNYLTDKSNKGHAELGANIAKKLFGLRGYDLVIGHSRTSAIKYNKPLSELEAPDDYSWILSSDLWLDFTAIIEPQLHGRKWKDGVKKNWENGIKNRKAGYDLSLEMRNIKE